MAINVDIRVDLSNLSQAAIENAVAARADEVRRQAEQEIAREALETKKTNQTEVIKDVKGIQDVPKWRKNPPRLKLDTYDIKYKHWNMLWYRMDIVPNQRRLRAYFSNTAGTSFRELNLDWAYVSSDIAINGDPSAPADPDSPTPENYLESYLPAFTNTAGSTSKIKPYHLMRKHDFPPTTTFITPKIIAGNSYDGYTEGRCIDSWIFNPRIAGLALSYSGPFLGVQRVIWERIITTGGARIAVLPLVDDIAVLVVFTETVIQKKQIDFYRIKQGDGTVPSTAKDYGFGPSQSRTHSFTIYSVYRYAQSIRIGNEASEAQTPCWEWVIFRIPPGFGKIASVTARLAPRRAVQDAAPTADNFDQTHGLTFMLCTSSSLPQHYKQYYPDKDYLTGQAKPQIIIEGQSDPTKDPKWVEAKVISPPMTIGTDPRFYNPSAYDNQGNLKPDARGYDLNEYYTETLYNIETGTSSTKRLYRGYAKTWGISNLDSLGTGTFQSATFGTVNEGDYLFVRIIECARDHNSPYPVTNFGYYRSEFHPLSTEVNDDTYKFNKKNGGYSYEQLFNENLYLTICTTEGDTFTLGNGSYSSSAYKETAHVMEDNTLTTFHNDLEGVEPNIRSFVVSDVALEEIETPGYMKTDGINKLFNRVVLNADAYQSNIIEGEPDAVIAHGDNGDKMFTNEYGPIPGKNFINESEGSQLNGWKPFVIPTGYSLDKDGTTASAPPLDVYSYTDLNKNNTQTTGGHAVRVVMPPPPRDAIYSISSFNSYMQSITNKLNTLDYREGQPLLGKKYIFSVYIKVNSVRNNDGTIVREGGVYPNDTDNCIDSARVLKNDPEYALICLAHVSNKNGQYERLHEYTVQQVEIGEWFRVWFTVEIVGCDMFRIDNWDGEFLSYIDADVWGIQLEKTNDKGKPTKYMPRRRFAQIYRNGIYSDAYAKANAYQTIGQMPPYYYYDPNTIPLDGVQLGIGIGFENNAQVQDMLNQLNHGGANFNWPADEQRHGEWSPAVYPSLGAGSPITSTGNGGSPADGGYGSGPGTQPRCFWGVPIYNQGPVADRRNGVWINSETQSVWGAYYAMAGEKITQANIGPDGIPDGAGLQQSSSTVRLNSAICDQSRQTYGDVNLDSYDYNRTIVSQCMVQGYGSVDNKYNTTNGTTGSMSGVGSGICTNEIGGGLAGTGIGSQQYYNSYPFEPKSTGVAGKDSDRTQCEFKLDKREKLRGWFKNQNYNISELFLRSDSKSLPQIVQFTSYGDLERNANSLRDLGYDPEVILGIGTNTPPEEIPE